VISVGKLGWTENLGFRTLGENWLIYGLEISPPKFQPQIPSKSPGKMGLNEAVFLAHI
jgi:hypothetical protein